jgi:hypothetical protein
VENPLSSEWLTGFIGVLESSLTSNKPLKWDSGTGSEFLIKVTPEVVNLIKSHQDVLLRAGKDVFKKFLELRSKQQDLEALVLVYSQLDNSALIEQYQGDTIKMAALAKQIQEDRNFWVNLGLQLSQKILAGALSVLLA